MFEKGEYISFANCGLPYYIGGEIKEKAALTLQTPASFNARFNVDVRVNTQVVAIDTAAKKVAAKNLVSGEQYEESYDKLVLSPGAAPIKPPLPGIDLEGVLTLRNIPDTMKICDYMREKNAKRVAIVGGGAIGIELAENFVKAGLETTIIEMQDHVIATLDYDMACEVHGELEKNGVKLMLSTALNAIEKTGDGLLAKTSAGDVAVDMVIMSVGVKPDTAFVNDAKIVKNARGAIVVDKHMLTSAKDVYAVGDAVEIEEFVTGGRGVIPLAGPANKQGRIAADNICGIKSTYKGTQGTNIIKVFKLAAASTGLNETAAKAAGLNYMKSYTYPASHATYYPGAASMAIKLLFEVGTGKILGVQLVGADGVDKRCDVFATAMRAGLTVRDLQDLELCYAPPFSSAKDPVNMAGYVASNMLDGRMKTFYWNDIENLDKEKVTLLDIRTAAEFERGTIKEFVNIPLDELRARMGELDKNKPVYLMCQVGLRGHIAGSILLQNGFDVYNLAGGYRLYNSIFGK